MKPKVKKIIEKFINDINSEVNDISLNLELIELEPIDNFKQFKYGNILNIVIDLKEV